MSAKGVLVNPTLVAMDLANCFDRKQTPENTDGKDGYIWVKGLTSNQSKATLMLDIRDHHKDLYEAKKNYIQEAVAFTRKRYPTAVINLDLSDTYGNINDSITEDNRMPFGGVGESGMNQPTTSPIISGMLSKEPLWNI